MVEPFVIVCLLLVLVCVVSRGYITRQLEVLQEELNEVMGEEQQAAGERRQAEAVLAGIEAQERQLKEEYLRLANELIQFQTRLKETKGQSPRRAKR